MTIENFSDPRSRILTYCEVLSYLEPEGSWRDLLRAVGWYDESVRLAMSLDEYNRVANLLKGYHHDLIRQQSLKPRSVLKS